MTTIIKPPRLRKGELIGVISPASAPNSSEKIEKGVRYLESLGYRVTVGKNAAQVHGYLAGTDEQRASDLNAMLNDKSVRAIFAVRGGYGTPRLLPLVDFRAAKRNPKIIVGYSDLTALQLALVRKSGLVSFSGPMVGVEMFNGIDPYTEEHFWRVLTSSKKIGALPNPTNEPLLSLRDGKASGSLLGGNLALLLSLLGTPYAPDFKKSILVLEDIDEAPHRIDRMMMQLLNAGILENLSGLAFGKFTACVPSDASQPHFTAEQVLAQYAKRLRVPVVANLQYGHIAKKLTLPFGVRAQMDAGKRTLGISGSAVA